MCALFKVLFSSRQFDIEYLLKKILEFNVYDMNVERLLLSLFSLLIISYSLWLK